MVQTRAWTAWSIAAIAVFHFAACDNAVEFPTAPLPTFDENSTARYFGRLEVDDGFPQENSDGTQVYQFNREVPGEPLPSSASPGDDSVPRIGRGPACYKGAPYAVLAQEGPSNGPNNIVIETQGGGACFVDTQSAGDCLAPNSEAGRAWPTGGDTTFVSNDPTVNPYTNNWDRVYLPYCDNSLYSSDTNAPAAFGENADEYRYYRGNQNFAAGLQIAKQMNPNPDKVLLSGFLGGGYGVVINIPLVQQVFPDSEIYVFTDGGTLVGDKNGVDGFLAKAVADFNAEFYIPASCTNCLDGGTLFRAASTFINESDDNSPIRLALVTGTKNVTIATIFLGYGDNIQAYVDLFVNALLDLDEAVEPSEFAAYLSDGSQSTVSAIGLNQSQSSKFDVVIDGTRFGDWIDDFLNPGSNWESVSESPLVR